MQIPEPNPRDSTRMRGRILIASELGGNLGHVLRIQRIAERLEKAGFEVGVALPRATAHAAGQLASGEHHLWECPRLSLPEGSIQRTTSSYAELLERHVLPADRQECETHYAAWKSLFEYAQPDLLLAEFAPSALLAARLCRLPVVHAGTGWEVPPVASSAKLDLPHLPMLRLDDLSKLQQLRQQTSRLEETLTGRANALLRASGQAELRHVGDIFTDVEASLLMTVSELDHFGDRPGADYIGPAFSVSEGARRSWPPAASSRNRQHAITSERRPRVLVYLSPHPGNLQVLRALDELHADVIAALPGLSVSGASRLGSEHRQLCAGPVHLEDLLPQTDLVISNGGHGLMAASLFNGIPVLALPRHQEQDCLARHAQLTGAVRVCSLDASRATLKECIADLLHASVAREAARAFAGKYDHCTLDRTLNRIVSTVIRARTHGKKSHPSASTPPLA